MFCSDPREDCPFLERNGGVKGGKVRGSGRAVGDWAERRKGKLRSGVKKNASVWLSMER